jgi:hypothetical protein
MYHCIKIEESLQTDKYGQTLDSNSVNALLSSFARDDAHRSGRVDGFNNVFLAAASDADRMMMLLLSIPVRGLVRIELNKITASALRRVPCRPAIFSRKADDPGTSACASTSIIRGCLDAKKKMEF